MWERLCRKRNTHTLLLRMSTGTATVDNSMETGLKRWRIELPDYPKIPLLVCTPKINKWEPTFLQMLSFLPRLHNHRPTLLESKTPVWNSSWLRAFENKKGLWDPGLHLQENEGCGHRSLVSKLSFRTPPGLCCPPRASRHLLWADKVSHGT